MPVVNGLVVALAGEGTHHVVHVEAHLGGVRTEVREERREHRLDVVALALLELGGKVVRPQPEDVAAEDQLVLEEVVESAAQAFGHLFNERIEEALHHALARLRVQRVVRARHLPLDNLPLLVRKLRDAHFWRADAESGPEVVPLREVERVVRERNAHSALTALLRGEREVVPPFVGEELGRGVLRRTRPRAVVGVVHLHAGDAGLVEFLDLLEHALLVERLASAPPPERNLPVAGRRGREIGAERLLRNLAGLREAQPARHARGNRHGGKERHVE